MYSGAYTTGMAVKATPEMSQSSTQPFSTFSLDTPLWEALSDAHFVGYRTSHRLRDAGYETVGDIVGASVFELVELEGVAESKAKRIKLHVGDLTVIEGLGAGRISVLLYAGFDPRNADQYSIDDVAQLPTFGREMAQRVLDECSQAKGTVKTQ